MAQPPELDLKTNVDREVSDAVRDTAASLPAISHHRARHVAPQLTAPATPTAGVPYKRLVERNPEWLGDYWRQCRALYAGGPRLLRDKELLKAVFPQHRHEAGDVYDERVKRAFYIAYPGEIIDHLLAGFAQDPIRLRACDDGDDAGSETELPEWWSDFDRDVSPPGGKRQTLSSFAVDCLREMFLTQSAWVLVDMPSRDPATPPPASRLEEEQAGLLDPYLCLMPSDSVIDWQVDEDTGELEWALCYWRLQRRDDLMAPRARVTERWVEWTRTGWRRYEFSWDPTNPPQREQVVPLVGEGAHTFGVVPLLRITVPEGLYAMGKLESIAREHFNKRCASSWAEYKALFAVLYEFLEPEKQGAFTPSVAQDPNRAVNQTRGQGYTQIRGGNDKAQYIGPDVAPFKEARESCAELMREMHRVMFSMALSANMDTAALQRSGESKAKDAAQIAAILAKVGEILREGFDALADLIARMRGELETPVEATGGEKFDAESVAASIKEATELTNGVPMKSPTFLKRYLFRLYKLALGPNASAADLEEIEKELDNVITAEAMAMADAAPAGPLDEGGADDADSNDRSRDDEDEDDEPPAPPKRTVRRMISSS